MRRAQGLRKAGLQGCGDGDCRSGPLAERVTVIMPSELVDGIGRFATAALGLANWAEVLPRGSLVVSDPAIDKEAAGVPRFCRPLPLLRRDHHHHRLSYGLEHSRGSRQLHQPLASTSVRHYRPGARAVGGGIAESINGHFRDELLNTELITTASKAQR